MYVSHSSQFDFQTQLYAPLTQIFSGTPHHLIFPHEKNMKQYPSKMLFHKHKCDVVIAELSYPSTGVGIELGWADACDIPILGIAKMGSAPSKSITTIVQTIILYDDVRDLHHTLLKRIAEIE